MPRQVRLGTQRLKIGKKLLPAQDDYTSKLRWSYPRKFKFKFKHKYSVGLLVSDDGLLVLDEVFSFINHMNPPKGLLLHQAYISDKSFTFFFGFKVFSG